MCQRVLEKKSHLDLLSLKCDVAQSLCQEGKYMRKRGRPSTSNNCTDKTHEIKKKTRKDRSIQVPSVRRDSTGHWPVVSNERLRCKNSICNLRSQVKCVKCSVILCLNKSKNCFVDFHL